MMEEKTHENEVDASELLESLESHAGEESLANGLLE
jgi:hypothetical protein